MWQIRAYRDDGELSAEWSLNALSDRELEQRLGFAPTKLGSTPLASTELASLADVLRSPVDTGLDYFLDFDADLRPLVQEPSELRASA